MSISATLPPLYRRWLAPRYGARLPDEPLATCSSCAMLPGPGEPHTAQHFDPRVKCCTFTPQLPNFLVGALLADDDPRWAEGRARMLARLASDDGVTPLGVHPRAVADLVYLRTNDGFGRARQLACTWVDADAGACSIWPWRGSTCTTWFCKHDRGALGAAVWRALQGLLKACERALASWCLLELGLPSAALVAAAGQLAGAERSGEALAAWELDDRPRPRPTALWGEWAERRAELYRACADRVAPLEWDDVLALGGVGLRLHVELLERALDRLAAPVPERLRCGEFSASPIAAGRVRIAGYRDSDPLELPAAIVELLGYFDGRPRGEVLGEIERATGWTLDEDFIARLVDHELLRPG